MKAQASFNVFVIFKNLKYFMNSLIIKSFLSELRGQVEIINQLIDKYEIKNPDKIFIPVFLDGKLMIVIDSDIVISALVT